MQFYSCKIFIKTNKVKRNGIKCARSDWHFCIFLLLIDILHDLRLQIKHVSDISTAGGQVRSAGLHSGPFT